MVDKGRPHSPRGRTTTLIKPKVTITNTQREYEVVMNFKPAASAPANEWVLVRGNSGYRECGVFITLAKYDVEPGLRGRWVDVQHDGLEDRGWIPVEWTDAPKSWLKLPETDAYDKLAQALNTDRESAKKAAAAMGFTVIAK